MEILQFIAEGFSVSLQPINLLYCTFGVLIGTLIGVLPGLGPSAAIALLIPTTFKVDHISAIIMLSGVYYGAMYGGSTTSILVSIPGEAASVVTVFDGYQMALQGKAGAALGISAFGSFIGGSIAIAVMVFIAPPLAEFAVKFGPIELFAVMVLGISILSYVARVSVRRAIIVAAFGLFISTVGQDLITGKSRFAFGIPELQGGISVVPFVMGLYGIGEILHNVEQTLGGDIYKKKIKNLLPSLEDWRRCIKPILRGAGIGFFCGLIPGAGPTISTFASYGIEKKVSRYPEQFGNGAIEGVAAPETANNAAAQAAFIPLFTLGIPTTAVAAVLFGALKVHGVMPGPLLISNNPALFWGVTTSMWVGNLILLILNLPLIRMWVRVLRVPYAFLVPAILLFCIIGSYSLRNTFIDVYIMLAFGLFGYLLRKFNYEIAPMVLALILGPMLEESLRQSLIISGGSLTIFFSSPISLVALSTAAFLIISSIFAKKRMAIGYDV